MCNENRNTIYQIDFSQTSDAGSWTSSGSNPIAVVDEKLRLIPNDATTIFERQIGNINTANNRLKIGFDLEIFRPLGSLDLNTDIVFRILQESTQVGKGTVCVTGIDNTSKAFFHLDRIFEYDNLSGPLTIQISVPNGFSNFIDIRDIIIQDFTFCDDELTMYFIFDQFFEFAKSAKTGLINLNSYNVDEQETLTMEFFNEQGGAQLDSSSEWFFSDADIDGANRIQDNDTPKSFNPFLKCFGLEYDTVNSFYGGFPTGTLSGSDYGTGILNLGWLKPEILNELLESKPGALAIKVNLTKRLKINFTMVLSNEVDANIFQNPFYHRNYRIEFDPVKCEVFFDYFDVLRQITVDQIHNGWLYGITGQQTDTAVVACDENVNFNGDTGTYEFLLDFGLQTGESGINYNSDGPPVKFTIEWNGQIITSGYVGSSNFDQQLINLGIPSSEINTGLETVIGELTFNKNLSEPSLATVRVDAPLQNSNWQISGKCPNVNSGTPVEIGVGDCENLPINWIEVYVDTTLPASQYIPLFGDVLYIDSSLTIPYDGQDQKFRMRVPTTPFQTILESTIRVNDNGVITGMRGCITNIGGEDIIEINGESSDSCESCWRITVTVPPTESRTVEFASNFASAGQYGGLTNCPGVGVSVVQDGTVTITSTTIFIVGIDGANGISPTNESKITVIVRNGASVVDLLQLTREHGNANC